MRPLMLLALLVAAPAAAEAGSPPPVRELICRGQANPEITTRHDPSPRNPAAVAVSLKYQRSEQKLGGDYAALEPGRCTWNPYGFDNIPPEPGVVEFDLVRVGGPTVPDPRNFSAYFGNPEHLWVFYVDDATNVAISHGPWGAAFFVGEEDLRTANRTAGVASLRQEQLRCRGGGGLVFERGATVASNQVAMTLRYTAAGAAAGPDGQGLAPGTCAWVDREAAAAEPGRITFITPGNAQLRQIQSGSPVDRSITAAERYPDAVTIPQYLTVARHYWDFTVSLRDPDSAVAHAAWTRPIDGSFSAGRAAAASQVQTVFDIRNVEVTRGLEGAVIRFEAAADVKPTVAIGLLAPAGAAPSLAFSESVPLVVSAAGTAGAGMMRYTAATSAPIARGTQFWYVITAPAGARGRLNQATGDFRTLAQHFTLGITEIRIISDGDADSNGDLYFRSYACPAFSLPGVMQGSWSSPLDWTEGRYPVALELSAKVGPDRDDGQTRSVPDKFRVVIVGVDDDNNGVTDFEHAERRFGFHCPRNPDIEPGATASEEWNAITMDFDLSRYPGTKATEPFYRRSKPLRDGARLAFEIRGYIVVERR